MIMSAVKIEAKQTDRMHSLTKFLAIALGLMTLVIVFISHDNPGITGGAVFQGVYGGASPFIVLALLLVVIYLYTRLR